MAVHFLWKKQDDGCKGLGVSCQKGLRHHLLEVTLQCFSSPLQQLWVQLVEGAMCRQRRRDNAHLGQREGGGNSICPLYRETSHWPVFLGLDEGHGSRCTFAWWPTALQQAPGCAGTSHGHGRPHTALHCPAAHLQNRALKTSEPLREKRTYCAPGWWWWVSSRWQSRQPLISPQGHPAVETNHVSAHAQFWGERACTSWRESKRESRAPRVCWWASEEKQQVLTKLNPPCLLCALHMYTETAGMSLD